ncbi:hypothetical protein [Tsukamurella paurometabola]|uniref:Uncharacterized protein n=1 Tax=Tsukamurella paurometabola TaxID=2061 RepID=A0ABS5NLX8_TSUPA|nr:hypothetical protein [Tsukamurella paurometabola]MBS4105040.1 hypothetical protein [Tsukamurella paurometabola]
MQWEVVAGTAKLVVPPLSLVADAGGANPSLVITAFAEYLMDRALGA